MPLLMSTFQFLNPNTNGPTKLALVDDMTMMVPYLRY